MESMMMMVTWKCSEGGAAMDKGLFGSGSENGEVEKPAHGTIYHHDTKVVQHETFYEA